MIWSTSDAPAVTTLLAPFPGRNTGVRFRPPSADAAPHVDDGFAYRNLDSRVTVGFPEASTKRALSALLPFDAYWPIRVEAAGRARHALLGKPTRRIISHQRGRRIQSALRVNDGRREGAGYKLIAIALFGLERVVEDPWKTSALKAQIARRADYARRLISSGYRSLLLGRTKRSQGQGSQSGL